MDHPTNHHHKYSLYVQEHSQPVSASSSLHRSVSPIEPDEYDRVLYQHPMPRPTSYIPRKPVPQAVHNVEVIDDENRRELSDDNKGKAYRKAKAHIYWVTPVAAVALFLVAVGAAIGHYVYFAKLNEQPVGNQIWTLRYSLAIAFIFKSTLAASISIALAQHVWFMLRRQKNGTSISAVDAMFLAESSLLRFLSPSLWFSALSTALMATCIWLMPLTALVAPTALTVGTTLTNTTDGNCVVPTLNIGASARRVGPTTFRSLFVTDNGDSYIEPSISSERLVSSVLTNGRQIGWPSPCGPNCTYSVQFTGPSWQCTPNNNVDDPRAHWEYRDWIPAGVSYWYLETYGNGSNVTLAGEYTDAMLYAPIYTAKMNASTNQFWVGYAAGFSRGLDPGNGYTNKTLQETLDVHVYYCQVANTSYSMDVEFNNGIQTNTLVKVDPLSIFDIPAVSWEGGTGSQTPLPLQDVIGLYTPLIRTLTGWIRSDPRYVTVTNTTLGIVEPLIQTFPNSRQAYGTQAVYIPRNPLGPLLEQLSQNVTVSLLSDPTLLVTSNATVPCYKSLTVTVWKVNLLPLVIAYAAGLGAAFGCLCIGAFAMFSNGVAHDTSFSSIIRTTRSKDLSNLAVPDDVGALPLPDEIGKRRVRLVDGWSSSLIHQDSTAVRTGFMLRK